MDEDSLGDAFASIQDIDTVQDMLHSAENSYTKLVTENRDKNDAMPFDSSKKFETVGRGDTSPGTVKTSETPTLLPPREIHSKTDAFLRSLKSHKKRASSALRMNSPSKEEEDVKNEDDVLVITDTREEKNPRGASSKLPSNAQSIVYDDALQAPSVPLFVKGNSVTISFSMELLCSKLSKRRKRREDHKETFRKFRAKIALSDNASAEVELKKQLSKNEFYQVSKYS